MFSYSIAVLLCAALCNATPLLGSNSNVGTVSETVSNTLNPFDGGLVGSCQIPNTTTHVCNINYAVPSYIAAIATIIEVEIRETSATEGATAECIEAKIAILCLQRFPRCESMSEILNDYSSVVVHPNTDCQAMLRQHCPDIAEILEMDNFCGLQQTTAPLDDTCSPVSSYDHELVFCSSSLGDDTMITQWMLELLKKRDLEMIRNFGQSGHLAGRDPNCNDRFIRYFCNFGGKCAGNRIELINTQQECEAAIACYDHNLQSTIQAFFPCHLWPSAADRPTPMSSPSDSIVNEITTTRDLNGSVNRPSMATWAPPGNVPFLLVTSASVNSATNTLNFIVLLISLLVSLYISSQ